MAEEIKMVTYEQLEKANEEMVLLPLETKKGTKEYAEVTEKVKAFRKVYPQGSIRTQIVSLNDGVCVIRAAVYDNEKILGEGTAYEVQGSNFINSTSYIENAETSAVGRALSFAGFALVGGAIASAEEVDNAMQRQQEMKLNEQLMKKNLATIRGYQKKLPAFNDAFLCKHYKVKSVDEIASSTPLTNNCINCFKAELEKQTNGVAAKASEKAEAKVAAEAQPMPRAVSKSVDPLDAYAKPVENSTEPVNNISPEDVIFKCNDQAPDEIKAFNGKKVGELSPEIIKTLARKNSKVRVTVSQKSLEAIEAVKQAM